MPEIYKGLTVPEYSDTADGVAAIRNLVDSGPVARVDSAQIDAIADAGVEVGTLVYYETFNALLQWCGPTLTWKPIWIGPWGHVDHWEASTTSQHTNTESTVAGLANLTWNAYTNRLYRVTVTGRLHWNDTGTSQGNPGWTIDGSVARAVVRLKKVSDNTEVVRVYDGRGGFVYGDDTDLFSTTWVVGGLSGEQEWKLTAGVANGQTTDDFEFTIGNGAATMVLIEDIGASGAPS